METSHGRPAPGTVLPANEAAIAVAVDVLLAGGLVGVPTETVYGLAADASSPPAVRRVFEAKGRPAEHPLIVHLPSAEALDRWAAHVPDEARLLAAAFWPGPLTLVLLRAEGVPLEVTGGRDTVAVRVPAHPVVRRLLEAFGGGLAAPSANRFGRVSPTTAADVVAELGTAVDVVLDGGPSDVGVESTIVELASDGAGGTAAAGAAPTVLRLGGLPVEDIEDVLGRPVQRQATGPARAPGMLASHYAPRVPVEVHDAAGAMERVAQLAGRGHRVGLLLPGAPTGAPAEAPAGVARLWHAGGDVAVYARHLYRWLREADGAGLDVLVAVPPPPAGLGAAVADRLRRAATR